MLKWMCWSGVVALALTSASGKDFSLEFKTIKPKDVMSFPGGYGVYTSLRLGKPAAVKKEPTAVSKYPVYGAIGEEDQGSRRLFRIDESKGTGKGYDLIIVDMNDNGDLTDDPVVKQYLSFWESRKQKSPYQEEVLFGPFQEPVKKIGQNRPVYYAQAYIYTQELKNPRRDLSAQSSIYMGSLRFKPGWYLETTVDLPGVKQKIGLFDTDGNLRLGDPWKPTTYNSSDGENWYFTLGDSFLVDMDHSGKFEKNSFDSEYCSFGSVLYLGARPCKVSLAQDYKSIGVEPWPEALADVKLEPQGEQLRNITLAREIQKDKWELMRPGVDRGKISVPTGNYRLYSTLLAPQASVRDQVLASGYKRIISKPMAFAPGKENSLRCGGPLEIKVTAQKDTSPEFIRTMDEKGREVTRALNRTNPAVRINAIVNGAGGEIYSSYGKGKDYESNPPKPTFAVFDAKDKQVGNGNLEFG